MQEVLKALQELNVNWKKIGHYNMKCRWDPATSHGHNNTMQLQSSRYFGDESTIVDAAADTASSTSPNVVKFEVQVNMILLTTLLYIKPSIACYTNFCIQYLLIMLKNMFCYSYIKLVRKSICLIYRG